MRELFQLDVKGHRLWGTYHPAAAAKPGRVGFLFLNPGHVPRSGHGGLSARAADRLAAQGFPCFRVDLPGLGDSDGPLPDTTAELYQLVCGGGFVEVAEAIHAELLKRHGLDGLVMGGLCGAATTSLYLADRAPEGVAGVFLFEPEFYLSEQEAANADGETPLEDAEKRTWRSRLPLRRVTSKVFSYWGWMRMLTRENEYARLFRYVPFPRQLLLDWLMDWGRLPAVANVPLVRAWQRVVQRGVPVLVITAEGKLRDVFFDRIHRAAFSDLKVAMLERLRLRGTNHIFTTGGAIDACIGHLSRWAGEHFGQDATPVVAVPQVAELRSAS
ncbi:alpha/beta fold hydrolase [Pyxidicoccus caerfyrddinensis]|uniref:alpha/beta fold hydrolase n=1 Tax=Pyxidicoccus caerfyrddinensis TaxID=2709663 RepID=UPI0013DC7A7F|nr:alpha/beta fold hydrolase [Pyxidicoccus caerfyrddinensis]